MVFHESLSDSKSPQVFRTLLSILASPFSNPLVTVPNAPITFGIIVPCMLHSFFHSLASSRYLSFFSLSFSFILWSAGTAKSTILQVLFFLLIIIKSGLLARIRWSVCHYYYYFYYYSFRIFHISVSWWFFTWVTASLLKSPGLVSGFCPFSAML